MKFEKGKSGNPLGRAAQVHPAVALARETALEAMQGYVETMRDVGEKSEVRMIARERILDRALGRPAQTTHLAGVDGDEIITRVLYGWADAKPDVPA